MSGYRPLMAISSANTATNKLHGYSLLRGQRKHASSIVSTGRTACHRNTPICQKLVGHLLV